MRKGDRVICCWNLGVVWKVTTRKVDWEAAFVHQGLRAVGPSQMSQVAGKESIPLQVSSTTRQIWRGALPSGFLRSTVKEGL